MAKTTDSVEMGTGDVFKDLGLEDAQERRLRTQLAMRVNDLLAARKLSQSAAARILGIAQPHVSELHNYKQSPLVPHEIYNSVHSCQGALL